MIEKNKTEGWGGLQEQKEHACYGGFCLDLLAKDNVSSLGDGFGLIGTGTDGSSARDVCYSGEGTADGCGQPTDTSAVSIKFALRR